jgi:hypothetical protein
MRLFLITVLSRTGTQDNTTWSKIRAKVPGAVTSTVKGIFVYAQTTVSGENIRGLIWYRYRRDYLVQ